MKVLNASTIAGIVDVPLWGRIRLRPDVKVLSIVDVPLYFRFHLCLVFYSYPRFISAIGVEANLYIEITDFTLDSRRFFRSLCSMVFMHGYCIDTWQPIKNTWLYSI